MQAPASESRPSTRAPSEGHRGKLAIGVVALVLAASAVFPLAVVLLGILVVVLVALDSGVPGLVPGLRTLFRVPVYPRSKRRARLVFAAGIGALLVACGTVGARLGSQVRTEWKLDQRAREASEAQLTELLERARKHVAAGEVGLAELTLMDAHEIEVGDPDRQREVDELLERVRRSGDADVILDILVQLPPEEFDALAAGDSVPEALDFHERALTRRAVRLALAQIEEARTRRPHP